MNQSKDYLNCPGTYHPRHATPAYGCMTLSVPQPQQRISAITYHDSVTGANFTEKFDQEPQPNVNKTPDAVVVTKSDVNTPQPNTDSFRWEAAKILDDFAEEEVTSTESVDAVIQLFNKYARDRVIAELEQAARQALRSDTPDAQMNWIEGRLAVLKEQRAKLKEEK